MGKEIMKTFRSAIFAGVYIGVAGFGFLAASTQPPYGNLAGAILFTLGLISIVGYKLKLFTGTAGFIQKNEIGSLFTILMGNIIGCLSIALLTSCSPMADAVHLTAGNIINTRIQTGIIECGLLAVGCGLLMTTAVNFAKQKNYPPLLLAVPLFIICGFPHCVADAYYYLIAQNYWTLDLLWTYISIVVGNAVGCNLYRILLTKEQYEN